MGYPRLENQIGKKYWRLTILSEWWEQVGDRRKRFVQCKCTCGNISRHRLEDIRSGRTKSCGCFNKDKELKHGLSDTRIYNIWKGVVSRCNNPSCKNYKNYGNRGISVCTAWLDVEIFYEWAVNNGYKDGLSIERKDVNEGYNPENCTWIPFKRQACNRRSSRWITYKGKRMIMQDWAKFLGF